ncbi:MAG TPA: (2Fe-2S)-binding protein [Polyangiaceae bacterium]|nr:(2Fe-2S)-binding protein [Polyangiaceae bacterium]
MIVCHCRAVSDRAIRASVREGASSLEAVSERTGAAECCGGCEPMVAEILDEELAARAGGSSPHVTTLRPLRILRDPRAA